MWTDMFVIQSRITIQRALAKAAVSGYTRVGLVLLFFSNAHRFIHLGIRSDLRLENEKRSADAQVILSSSSAAGIISTILQRSVDTSSARYGIISYSNMTCAGLDGDVGFARGKSKRLEA
jgi:hypothetical protein